ncbi:MAG: glycine cleavage system aminomethyltransferase GcvT [Halanaerobium sp.]
MKKTPLNHTHNVLGAKMTDFGGWEMPVEYSSIIDEHHAVRNSCGLFDICHMGEIMISGEKAAESVQKLITNDLKKLEYKKVLYTPICNQEGGIIDDLLVYMLGEDKFLLVVNAANTIKDYEWIKANVYPKTKVENLSDNYALLALQGPESKNVLKKLSDIKLDEIDYYHFEEAEAAGVEMIISRTGYTGELGYELYFAAEKAEETWQRLIKAGEEFKLMPAGLGARNTLRLEKGYALYGNDIDENTNPIEAGLGWTVKLDGEDFIGRDSLLKIKEECCSRRLKGIVITGRGLARHGYDIYAEGEKIGQVTSGSYSPSLKKSIAVGYLDEEYTEAGSKIQIKIRDRFVEAEVVELPFIK